MTWSASAPKISTGLRPVYASTSSYRGMSRPVVCVGGVCVWGGGVWGGGQCSYNVSDTLLLKAVITSAADQANR